MTRGAFCNMLASIAFLVVLCGIAEATLPDSVETHIDETLAAELGFVVHVFDESWGESGYLDVYISIPDSYRGAHLSIITLKVGNNGQELLDTHLERLDLDGHMGLKEFSGVNIRVYDKKLDCLKLRIFYKRGEITRDILGMDILEYLPKDFP